MKKPLLVDLFSLGISVLLTFVVILIFWVFTEHVLGMRLSRSNSVIIFTVILIAFFYIASKVMPLMRKEYLDD